VKLLLVITLLTACAVAQNGGKEEHPLGQSVAAFTQEAGLAGTPCHKGHFMEGPTLRDGHCLVSFGNFPKDKRTYWFVDVLPEGKKNSNTDQGGHLLSKDVKFYFRTFDDVVAAMTEKYGKPPDSTGTVKYQNEYGARNDEGLAVWSIDKGTDCSIEEGFETIRNTDGSVRVLNQHYVKVEIGPHIGKTRPEEVKF